MEAVIKNMFSLITFFIYPSTGQSFRASTVLIFIDKISENIRNKSYEIITHSAVKPKMINYEYMQSMNYTGYNG